MPWVRRFSTVIVTVATAMLIYGVYTFLCLRQIAKHFTGCRLVIVRPNGPPPGYVEAFGLLWPMWLVWTLWLILPLTALGFEIYWQSRRRWWERHDRCADCGYRLTTWRGKCPGCGVRVGPG